MNRKTTPETSSFLMATAKRWQIAYNLLPHLGYTFAKERKKEKETDMPLIR